MKKFKNSQNECYDVDGKQIWVSRSVAVCSTILIEVKDRVYVLAGQRGDNAADFKGKWNLICGYLDWDESGWDAVVRELYEETSFYVPKFESNLIFDNDKEPWFVRTDPGENRQNISLSYCLIYDFSKRLPTEIETYKDSEIEEIKWIPVEQVLTSGKQWSFNHDERIEMAVEKFQKYLI